MPDKSSPTAQPEVNPEPAEFDFDQPATENPRIKRRSLKAKNSGLKPAPEAPSARELEQEGPPVVAASTAQPAQAKAKPATATSEAEPTKRTTPVAPSRATPPITASAPNTAPLTAPQRPAASATTPIVAATPATPASPHGTRPATLYYSSYPKKETSPPMKTTTTASPAAAPLASSTTRPATIGASPRPAPVNIDYRANVERQSREQKSVGNILSYVVYGLIAVFVLGAGLAIYGSVIIFGKLHDQSATLSDLDAKYALKVNALNTQITATRDTLAEAQAEIARQQDLINKQQEDINRLLFAITDNANALKAEKQTRAQETAVLRTRVRDLEYKTTTAPTTQKY